MALTRFCRALTQLLQGNDSVAEHIADVCNSMMLGGSVCVAFDYNTATMLAFFRGQPPRLKIDFGDACVIPNITAWVLQSGLVSTFVLHMPKQLVS